MQKTIQDILEEAGLSGRETNIYLKLLSLGETNSGDLIKETKMYKADIYEVIKKLIKRGLVSYVKTKGKLFYKPADPKKLLDIIDDKKAELEQKRANISSVLSQLEEKYEAKKIKKEVSVLEGIEGLKTILIDAAKEGKPIYILGADMKFVEMMAYRLPQWEDRRAKLGIKLNGIWIDRPEIRNATERRPLISARYLSEEMISPLATWTNCGDIVAIFVFDENPLIIKIKSMEIAEAFRKYFDLMWRIAKD